MRRWTCRVWQAVDLVAFDRGLHVRSRTSTTPSSTDAERWLRGAQETSPTDLDILAGWLTWHLTDVDDLSVERLRPLADTPPCATRFETG